MYSAAFSISRLFVGEVRVGCHSVEVSDEMDNCPCGQDIKEHCFITNRLTGHQTNVGNVCINRFMGISTRTLFAGLKRIAEDDSANANDDLVD
jgi:hypothetical protein